MPQSDITLNSYAKVNLYLDVIRRRPDGYHEIRTLFTPVDLHDTITLTKNNNDITITCDDSAVPCDESNLAYKATSLFFRETGATGGISIEIRKKIPVAAGLGGGSSNAAAMLNGMNALYGGALSKERLISLAASIGADVPFFIETRPALATGIGDEFVSFPRLVQLFFVLVNPGIHVSAKWAYESLSLPDGERAAPPLDTPGAQSCAKDIAKMLRNSLEEPVARRYPVINDIKRELVRSGASGALMSGSGSTVFGVYQSRDDAAIALERVKAALPAEYLVIPAHSITAPEQS